QKKEVAAQQPEVLKKMRDHYEQWWAGVEPRLNDFTPVVIGAKQENPVKLSSADWANVYCDNMNNLRNGLNANGPWHLEVARDGDYEIELRRWPREADAAIAAGVPEFKAVDGRLPAGKALPIKSARVTIGAADETRPVTPDDKVITFRPPPEPCGPPRPSSDAPGEHAESTRESHAASSNCDPTAELKQGLEATRLPPKLKEQILAELPPLEERKRMYRELQQSGGLSSEE